MISILLLASIGALAIILVLMDSLWSVIQLFSAYLKPFFQPGEVQSLQKKYGPWAVITGSTDGIGKQYALELARHGLSIVLVSRSVDRLRNVAAEIEQKYAVKTKVIQADFSGGESVYTSIESELDGLDFGLLVNNVGQQYEYPMPLGEVSVKSIWRIIRVNVCAVTLLSRTLLPRLLARPAAAIVNVSSGAELQPMPYMNVYAATKAYIASFTEALREEYSNKGLTVQHISPLFVATKMNAFNKHLATGGLFVPNAETYARHAVATLGKVDHTTGYWLHGIQYFLASIPPVWIRSKVAGAMNKRLNQEYFQAQEKSKNS